MAKRRGDGEGSIYQRADGTWAAALSLENGRRRFLYGRTRRDVQSKLQAAVRDRQQGLPLVGERLTLGAYLTTWLEAIKPNLRPESYRRYEELCRLHIVPELGKVPLAKLTPQQVQAAYSHRLAAGLSGTTANLMHGCLHKALEQALRWNQVVRNVADLVDPPRRNEPRMRALSPEEASRLLETAMGDRLEALYVLAVTCGLRLGELQALKWEVVDLDRATLRVTATLQGVQDGSPILGEPKSAKSRRQVHLSRVAVEALRRHRVAQLEERLRLGAAWADHGLVFTNEVGHPLDGNNLRVRSFARLLAKAGLPPMRFHDLRHTAATLLMSQGVPVKVASELLGHADVAITLRVYSHVLPGMQEQAAEAMDRLFAASRAAQL